MTLDYPEDGKSSWEKTYMSDIHDFSPLWGEWEVEEKLGEGSFGTVWKVRRNVIGGRVYYAAVKHISIPRDDSEVRQLIGEGIVTDEDSAAHYYSHVLQSLADEIDAMHKLRGFSNIVAYEDHKIIPKAGGIGYDLLLRMELLTPLTEKIQQGMSVDDVVSLGKDIATAISVLHKFHMIHRDIKPQNIFVNSLGIYKLGDYGTARALGTVATAMSRKGTYNYMSPEIYSNRKADIRADIYSLGIVLYRLLNGNRLPFLPADQKIITNEDSEQAFIRRISGETLPAPKYADAELSKIVLRACSFNPEERYGTPEEMIKALENYKNKGKMVQDSDQYDETLKTDFQGTNDTKKQEKSPDENEIPERDRETRIADDQTTNLSEPATKILKSGSEERIEPYTEPRTQGRKKWLIPIGAILLIGLIAGVLWRSGILTPAYTITWQDDTGNTIDTTTADYGKKPTHTDIKKESDAQYSYIFSGWEPEIKAVTGDATYKAVFKTETRVYAITWQDEMGKTIDTTTAEYGSMPVYADITKESDAQYSYVFSGWEPNIQAVTGDAAYKASFNKNIRSYTITWQDDAGEAIDTTTVEYNAKPTHADPTKEMDQQYSYTFAGWEPEIQTVTGDVIYKACFTKKPRSYVITWEDETGKTIDTTTVEYGEKPTHTDIAKESDAQYSYAFSGWEPDIESVTGDATCRASFRKELRSYTITWEDETGKTIDTTTAEYGKKPTHADIKKGSDSQYSYTFSGWEPEIQTVTGDATYRASFQKELRSYIITWQNDTGETFDTTTVKYGEKPTYITIPIKESDEQYTYEFSRWEPEIKPVTGDATYKATFKSETRKYTITWQDDTGKTIDTTIAEYGSKPAHTDIIKDPDEQYSYTFSGWEPEIKTVTGNATYEASFQKEVRSYTIIWQDDTGNIIDTTIADYGTIPTHTDPVKEPDERYSYIFNSWEPDITAVTGSSTYKATFNMQSFYGTVGKTVTFGHYEQDDNSSNGAEEIEWIVLDVQGDKALLLSRYGLDVKPFNNRTSAVTWETSSIRYWLNHDFLNSAFSQIEQDAIILTKVDNSLKQGYEDCVSGGNDTQDKVFLLSCAETTLYFQNKEERRLALTAYAIARGAHTSDYGYQTLDGKATGWWWLRSPGLAEHFAARVNCDGTINYRYNVNSTLVAVRPALWLDLESDFFESGESN